MGRSLKQAHKQLHNLLTNADWKKIVANNSKALNYAELFNKIP